MSTSVAQPVATVGVLLLMLASTTSCSYDDAPAPEVRPRNAGVGSAETSSATADSLAPTGDSTTMTLTLNDTQYVHRHSEEGLHEFTPAGQEDLQRWTDMLSINVYADARDGEALAQIANAVLANYQAHGGRVLRTDSVPRTNDRAAEHLIVVVFGDPGFIEAVQARFLLADDVGMSVIHSHRVYGTAVGDEMSRWLELHGPQLEQTLMAWDGIPAPDSLRDLSR